MSSQQQDNESRPLLPSRNFGLTSWLSWRPSFRRGYGSVAQGVEVESSDPSHDSDSDISRRLEAGPSDVPPPPPNTPPQRPAESSTGETSDQMLLRTSQSFSSRGSSQEKLCLICLEPLLQEEFERGIAMVLQCDCKGDAALRHKHCAQRWVDTKGDLTCDVCRAPILNLDAPQPRSEAGSAHNSDDPTDASRGRYPTATDVFDCIRMTWVVTIVCILFLNVPITFALVTGLLFAVMYTWSCQLLRCVHAHMEHAFAAHVENRQGETETEQQQQPMPAIVIV